MIPRTKIQKHVVELNKRLHNITDVVAPWAYDTHFKFWALKTAHTATCFECGHHWKIETNLISKLFPMVCPNCGKGLEAAETKKWRRRAEDAFRVIHVFEGFQVIRVFMIHQYCDKGKEAEYSCHEVYQHWISPKGKMVVMSVRGGYNQGYHHSGFGNWYGIDMEVRKDSDRYHFQGLKTYPKTKYLPILKRNGFKGSFHGLSPSSLFQLILTEPMAETLLKSKQTALLGSYRRYAYPDKDYNTGLTSPGKIVQYWQSIKICIRNKYFIKDPSDWFDYLRLLQDCGKDINNAKYICPVDFHQEHQRYIEKRNAIIEKKELDKLVSKIEASDLIYQEDKKKYFDICMQSDELSIIVIPNVRDFYLEGKRLHHCIFTNRYYALKDSLILSARIGDKRLETIEVSLSDYTIRQSRGLQNQNSSYHKKIVKLIADHMNLIRNAGKKKRKVKQKQLKQVA